MSSNPQMPPLATERASELRFGADAVRAWAEFSGDYNPVHFDPQHAREAGLDGLIVHGMLALLPVKQALTAAAPAPADPDADGLHFRSVFRNPIPYDEGCTLVLRNARKGLDFRLSSAQHGHEHFRGGLAPCAFGGGDAPPRGGRRYLNSAELSERTDRLARVHGDVDALWVGLDAIVFADFLHTHLERIQNRAYAELGLDAAAAPRTVVFQTSHSVRCPRSLAEQPLEAVSALGGISYAIPEDNPMVVGDGQVAGVVEIGVYDRLDHLTMAIEVGLVAKTLN